MNEDLDKLIKAWGGVKAVAEQCEIKHWAVYKWRDSGCVPPRHWSTLVRRGFTLDRISKIGSER